jgi:hypothetical protein
MSDYEHFVKGLGPYAKHYTSEQLKQLHVEVRRLAELLLESHYAAKARADRRSSPQTGVDGTQKTVHQ